MEHNYSKTALLRFLETLGEKGLANQNTAEGLRVAVTKILSDLSAEEEADVRRVDVEAAVHRFHNRNPGQISPKSLAEYQRRVALSIRHFINYTENPTAFRPLGRGTAKRNGAEKRDEKRGAALGAGKPAADSRRKSSTGAEREEIPASGPALALSYPLRPDFLAQVLIPRDMKREEARRLSAFIMTLASDFSPEG